MGPDGASGQHETLDQEGVHFKSFYSNKYTRNVARHLESDGGFSSAGDDVAALVVTGVRVHNRSLGEQAEGGLGGVEDFLDLHLGWRNEQDCSIKLAMHFDECVLCLHGISRNPGVSHSAIPFAGRQSAIPGCSSLGWPSQW
jgi:hypothetical protein